MLRAVSRLCPSCLPVPSVLCAACSVPYASVFSPPPPAPDCNRLTVVRCTISPQCMLTCTDDVVGRLVASLKAKAMWEDTLMVWSADNGGPQYWGSI